jgi:hypothetical protein
MAAKTIDSHIWDLIAAKLAVTDVWGHQMAATLRLVEKNARNVGREVSDETDIFRERHEVTEARFASCFDVDSAPRYDDVKGEFVRNEQDQMLESIEILEHIIMPHVVNPQHIEYFENLKKTWIVSNLFKVVIDVRICAKISQFIMNDLMIA